LDSILDQSVKPLEILIVDGYSRDETLDILREYKEVKIIGSAKGIGSARKILAKSASGDIIAWIDADILVPSNWMRLHLETHEEESAIMILSGKWSNFKPLLPEENLPSRLCELTPIHEWLGVTQAACTMKRSVFNSIDYDENFRRAEEWDLIVSAHRKGIRSHYSEGLFAYHLFKPRKKMLKNMLYAGNYILFLHKYGFWYLKFNPRHLFTFLLRLLLVYSLPLSLLNPWVLLSYPLAFAAYLINFRIFGGYRRRRLRAGLTKLLVEFVRGIGEHLHLLRIITRNIF
jgi:glycosyltransferase involved in cell wall biosynthesis